MLIISLSLIFVVIITSPFLFYILKWRNYNVEVLLLLMSDDWRYPSLKGMGNFTKNLYGKFLINSYIV